MNVFITCRSLLSRVELDPASNRLQLQEDRSNIRTKYGYDLDKKGHLYPEEALYLLELVSLTVSNENQPSCLTKNVIKTFV